MQNRPPFRMRRVLIRQHAHKGLNIIIIVSFLYECMLNFCFPVDKTGNSCYNNYKFSDARRHKLIDCVSNGSASFMFFTPEAFRFRMNIYFIIKE